MAYFLYMAALTLVRSTSPATPFLRAVESAAAILLLARTAKDTPSWNAVRDWIAPAFILAAYRLVDSFPRPHNDFPLESKLQHFDRYVLHSWALQRAIEATGALLPGILEFVYLVLYAVPVACLAVFYLNEKRERAEPFLFSLFCGTFAAYSLLPFFPSQSPRLAYPGQDLPHVVTIFRQANIWILNICDIHVSVFPSGHVAVAFASAFAMMRYLPERRLAGRILFVFAILVWVNTVYGRYHYAADGLLSLLLTILAVNASFLLHPRVKRWTERGTQAVMPVA